MTIIRILSIALLAVALQISPPAYGAKPPERERQLTVRNGLVIFQGRHPSMLQALNDLCVAANLDLFVFEHLEDSQVSLEFRDRPVEEVLRSLLRGRNYSVVYRPEGKSAGLRMVRTGTKTLNENIGIAASSSSGPAVQNRQAAAQEAGPAPSLAVRTETLSAAPDANPSDATEKSEASVRLSSISASGFSTPQQATEAIEDSVTAASENVSAQNAPSQSRRDNPAERLQKLIAMYEKRIASGQSDKDYQTALALSGGGYQITHDRDRVQFWKEALKRHTGP